MTDRCPEWLAARVRLRHTVGGVDVAEEHQPETARLSRSLNEAFYSSEPAAYLRTRLTSALQMPPDLRQAHDDPESLRNQVLRRLPGWGVEDWTDLDEQAASQVVEAFALAHHAGEVLLRHVLAQLQYILQRSSPWLALAALQNPKMFRDRCRRLADASEEELQAIFTHVFLPHWDEIVQGCGEAEGAAGQVLPERVDSAFRRLLSG